MAYPKPKLRIDLRFENKYDRTLSLIVQIIQDVSQHISRLTKFPKRHLLHFPVFWFSSNLHPLAQLGRGLCMTEA
jgi:hypothetical protein